MLKRKYIVLLMVTLVSIPLAGLLYSNIVQAQTTVTGYISVPASAIVSVDSTAHTRVDPYLRNLEPSWLTLYGPVQLPHGATVKNFTCYWYDVGMSYIYMGLARYNMSVTVINDCLAETASQGTAGDGSSYDDTIEYATVDNSHYAYIMAIGIDDSPYGADYKFKYAVIEYTLPSGAVGGLYIPVDKFSLLAPYVALVSTIILTISISVAYIKYIKKQ